MAVGVRHDVPFTATVGEVSWLEVDMVIAIVNEGEIVFVVIDINVHIFVSVHVLIDLGWELGVAIYAFYEVFAVAPRLEIIRIA